MSKIIELDDFEIHSDISSIEVEYYAIYFFYLIEWAYSRKMLLDELETYELFINDIKRVRNKEMDCFDFLLKQLDFKLCTSFFKDDIVIEFIKLYIGIDYDPHIRQHMWQDGGLWIQTELITNIYKPIESKALMEDMDNTFKLFLEINHPDKVDDYFSIMHGR